jgi:adenine C2-methylase RlmN of 23S rRNA A2503 and tRNA A37
MIEYILIKDVNSTPALAHELGKLLQGRKVSINLIPYNPTKIGTSHGFETPDEGNALFELVNFLFPIETHSAC